MKITFRSTFLGSLLMLVGATAFLVGASSYVSAKFTAHDLSEQLVEQTSARIDAQVQRLVGQAARVTAVDRRILEAGLFQTHDFHRLVPYWLEVLAVHEELTSIYLGLESTGECTGASRLQGKLSIWQSDLNPMTHLLDQREFWPDDYPTKPYAFDPAVPAPDIRGRPWYEAARTKHGPIWTESFRFLGLTGVTNVQGITYAEPMYAHDGTLLGVMSTDLELRQLSTFLSTLHIAKTGFAFIVERRADGSKRLVAHPDLSVLQAAMDDPSGVIGDARARALVGASGASSGGFSAVHFDDGGASFIGGTRALSGEDSPPWLIGIVVPEAEVLERVNRSNRNNAAIAIGGLLLALVCGVWVARQVARPLERLAEEMAAIGELQLEPKPIVHSVVLEVDRVAVATEEIKTGLRQKRVLEKYVPRGARKEIARNRAGDIALGGERVRRTILFSDLRGFTSMSERLAPDAVVRLLNAYLEGMTSVILGHGGDINEYIGDAILAVFHETRAAVSAATAMQEALQQLSRETDDDDLRGLRMGIGIHVGEVVEGNIGTIDRVKFGVVGDTVNLAARIQDRSRDGKHTCVLVSEAVEPEVASAFELELFGDLTLKGKAQPVRVFEVVARRA